MQADRKSMLKEMIASQLTYPSWAEADKDVWTLEMLEVAKQLITKPAPEECIIKIHTSYKSATLYSNSS